MFTGLIEDIGVLRGISNSGNNYRVTVGMNLDIAEISLGDSIAVDGACYTAVELYPGAFVFEASAESLYRTTLADMPEGTRVHLERAAKLGSRLDGHIVQGHVDGVGEVLRAEPRGNSWYVEIKAPPEVARLLVPKGSVAINGTSLTINGADLHGGRFDVMVVPFTSQKTLLPDLSPGQKVNLEADILGKYVLWLLRRGVLSAPDDAYAHPEDQNNAPATGLDLDFLRRHGFA